MTVVLALDLGGSGSRGRLVSPTGTREITGRRLQVEAAGLVAAPLVTDLARRLVTPDQHVDVVCIGSSGLLTLVPDPAVLVDALREVVGRARVVIASDAVTSMLGALGGKPGAVLLTGTGSTALGTDLDRCWRKVDGWGHVLGDAGSGSWIGARALALALEQHDGRRQDAVRLLAVSRERFGEPETWPRQIYTRDDRAGVLASAVTDVVDLAVAHDPCAAGLLSAAGTELARSLISALRPPVPPLASWTGGIFHAGEVVLTPLREALAAARPDVTLIPPTGGALDGAQLLAERVLRSELTETPPLFSVF